MKKLLFLALVSLLYEPVIAQCVPSFSYSGSTDTISFMNSSVVSDAHYYWDFGDGSGSTVVSPLHIFPDDGEYLVTLYVLDTITGCSDYSQSRISVVKPDTSTCDLQFSYVIQSCITDSCLYMTDSSTNCGWTYRNFDGGPGLNHNNVWLGGGWVSAVFLAREQAYVIDTASNSYLLKEYYQTVPFAFSPTVNYQPCSANFEIELTYLWNGAIATFTAMNRFATSYQWEVIGFGNPIYSSTNVISQFYPYQPGEQAFPWLVVLRTNDTINDCGETFTRHVLIRDPYFNISTGIEERTSPGLNCYPNPTTDILNVSLPGSSGIKTITVIDVVGHEVHGTTTVQNEFKLDVNALAPGLYLIQVIDGDKIYHSQFIRQ